MNSESLPAGNSWTTVPATGVSAVLESAPPSRPFSLPIPPILLEGDDAETETVPEDARKFSLGCTALAEELETEGELPESYGTQKLLLTARDPNWLCAHWDLTCEQLREHSERAGGGHLTLRVHRADLVEKPVAEIQVHPGARHWFVHVERAGTPYRAELGCCTPGDGWISISTSTATLTPPNQVSFSTAGKFVTIPFETPLAQLLALAEAVAAPGFSLTEALEQLRREGHPDLPATHPPSTWTADQARALAAVSAPMERWAEPLSSLDLTQTRPQSLHDLPTSPGGVSSPFGGVQPHKSFWFNVNAELIVYGATEPNATVTIGGRPIPLRPDGSFSYRFTLPDGQYELPVVAVSADQTDGRAAELKFSRATELRGEVGVHPQNSELKTPAPENL